MNTQDIADLVLKFLPAVTAIIGLIKDENVLTAILRTNELTDEQRAAITALREAAVARWEELKPLD